MKECPRCGFIHNKPGIYCSRRCANVRVHSDETKQKISNALAGRKIPTEVLEKFNWSEWRVKVKITWNEKYMNTPFDQLGETNRRRRVIEEQHHCCAKCGISEWLGSPITLELDHKDGNNENNVRENLEALCPNCHSTTETWRGRNKPYRNGISKVSDEHLIDCIKTTKSLRQALLKAGLAAKGGNYRRVKELSERIKTQDATAP